METILVTCVLFVVSEMVVVSLSKQNGVAAFQVSNCSPYLPQGPTDVFKVSQFALFIKEPFWKSGFTRLIFVIVF